MKSLFVIGDVHGCYHTAKSLIKCYWKKDSEVLIQIGDLLNKGNHPLATLKYFKRLQQKHPDKVIVLKGNNEYSMLDQYRSNPSPYQKRFEENGLRFEKTLDWLENLPLVYQTKKVFISHAGISMLSKDPYDLGARESLLFTRSPLRHIGKAQIVGHMIQREVNYKPESNAWYIDTGAGNGDKLSGIKVTKDGTVKAIFSLRISHRDFG